MNKRAKILTGAMAVALAGGAMQVQAAAGDIVMMQCTLLRASGTPAVSSSVVYAVTAHDKTGDAITVPSSIRPGDECGGAISLLVNVAPKFNCNLGGAGLPVLMTNGTGYGGPLFVCTGT
jgi:hypothetical protein